MSAKTKKGTTPTHAHDTSLTHGGAAEEGPVAGATSATQVLRALAPPPDHRGRGGRQDVTLEPEQFGPGCTGGTLRVTSHLPQRRCPTASRWFASPGPVARASGK